MIRSVLFLKLVFMVFFFSLFFILPVNHALAAWVVSLFENTLQSLVLLTIYLPIVAGMGGNAATQTLAVMVRGISRGEVDIKRVKKPLIREIKVGAINGIVVAIVAFWFNSNALLGFVVGVFIVLNLVIAAFFWNTCSCYNEITWKRSCNLCNNIYYHRNRCIRFLCVPGFSNFIFSLKN